MYTHFRINLKRHGSKRRDFLTKTSVVRNIRLYNKMKKRNNFIPVLFWDSYVQGVWSFSDSSRLETTLLLRNNTRAPRNNVVRLTNTWEISLKLRSSYSRYFEASSEVLIGENAWFTTWENLSEYSYIDYAVENKRMLRSQTNIK